MNYESIQTFITLAETLNFTRAAELLYISQPTVSSRIRCLEQELGQPLFIRTSKAVELTPAGKAFLPAAAQLYTKTIECTAQMKNYRASEKVSISAPATSWDYGPLHKSVISYCVKNPHMVIQLERDVSKVTMSKIAANETDVGVVYLTEDTSSFEYIPYYAEELLLVASPKLDITEDDIFDEERKKDLRLIFPRYAAVTAQLIAETFSMIPFSISSDHPSMYCNLVKAGLGVGIIQRTVATEGLRSGELVEIDCKYNTSPMLHKSFIVTRKEKCTAFRDVIEHLLATREPFPGCITSW